MNIYREELSARQKAIQLGSPISFSETRHAHNTRRDPKSPWLIIDPMTCVDPDCI